MSAAVRTSTAAVMATAQHVSIDMKQLAEEVTSHADLYCTKVLPPDWAQSYHFSDPADAKLTAQYVLVLDSLNFCFWPLEGYEYAELAGSLKAALLNDRTSFDAENLIFLQPETLAGWLQPPGAAPGSKVLIPQLEERTRILREVGTALKKHFGGFVENLILAAKGSASDLVDILTSHFPNFRDHAIYKGQQIFFYKRAQIFVGDVFGAFEGKGLGHFSDMGSLTCFPDYRIPQLLRDLKILRYSEELNDAVDTRREIQAGSEEEVEIRSATVQAVEAMLKEINKQSPEEPLHAFQLDWLLWERGEAMLAQLTPHHRTLTIFY